MSNNLDGNLVFTISEDIVCRNNDDGTIVVMNLDNSDAFFKIDGIAAEVFQLINSKRSFSKIVDTIHDAYEYDKERILSDTSNLLSQLLAKNIISAS
jgi:hypothetical protein